MSPGRGRSGDPHTRPSWRPASRHGPPAPARPPAVDALVRLDLGRQPARRDEAGPERGDPHPAALATAASTVRWAGEIPSRRADTRVAAMKPIARERPAPHEPAASTMIAGLERVRRFAWRGNGRRALQLVSDVEGVALDIAEPGEPLEPDGDRARSAAPGARAAAGASASSAAASRTTPARSRTAPSVGATVRSLDRLRGGDRRPSHGGALPPGKQQGP